MGKRALLVTAMIIVSVLTLGALIIKPAYKYLSGYLSKSEHVKANILIVEGWLPDYTLEIAYKEFQNKNYKYIITTGIKSSIDYYGLFSNGFLIFYPGNRFTGMKEYSTHSIEIDAYSDLGEDNRAHFNLYINDSLAADFYAEKRKQKYSTRWKGSLNKIDSITVQFDNDSWGKFGDRNLFVKDVTIDHKITMSYMNNSEYAELQPDRKLRSINNYNSNAELARNRLIFMGIDSTKIIATPGERVRINRTLTSALAFRDWVKMRKTDIKGINILSMGTHARRTWMTYNKVLNEKYEIGIISIPDYRNNHSGEIKVLKILRETLSIIYYWLILIPY